ncbi:unnamed protein product [Dibothriocephalus latus]|uniref:DUF5733 domain-containing protein n=1 Tax=Dibothriocephalus latus TaxID=60516 RepID=A0A3P6TDY1_DIBLA|nr:unnamed protein product [Dibothriocephalus latus]
MIMQSSGYGNGERGTLVMCEILKRKSASHPLKESVVLKTYEKISEKKKSHPKDRYAAKVTSKQIAFESIKKAKKEYPIVLAEVSDVGRIPADPNVFSLQVPQDKKKKSEEDGPVLLYLIRFEDSTAVDKYLGALNGNNKHSTALEGPSASKGPREGQSRDKLNKAGENDGARTARTEDSSVRISKTTEDENMRKKGQKIRQKSAPAVCKVSYVDGMLLGETASDVGTSQPPVDTQCNCCVCSGSESHIPHSGRRGSPLSRRDAKVNKRPAVPQQRNRVGFTQTFVQYQPAVGLYGVAPTRKSRMVVDPWPGRSHSHRRAYTPPSSESSMTSASSDVTLCCTVSSTSNDVDREIAFLEDRERWGGMYKSYRRRYQDSVF